MTCRNFQLLQVLESVLRLKAETDSRAAEVRKILLVKKKRESLHRGMKQDPETSGPMGQVRNWVLIGFFFFFFAQGWRCLLGANRNFLGRRKVSLDNYHLLGPPAVCPSGSLLVSLLFS
jgi:hypothetical protein